MNPDKVYHIPDMVREAQSAYDEIVGRFDDYEVDRDIGVYFVDFWGSGSDGVYQMGYIVQNFGLERPEDAEIEESSWGPDTWEFDHELVEEFADEVCEVLDREVLPQLDEVDAYEATGFGWGYSEGDGSFGIELIVERDPRYRVEGYETAGVEENAAKNRQVAEAWARSEASRSGSMFTNGRDIFSYNLLIGYTEDDGTKVALDYTAPGHFVSQTTSTHVGLTRQVADVSREP